jgi:hypothetical protein
MTSCKQNARKRSHARACGLLTLVLSLMAGAQARAEPAAAPDDANLAGVEARAEGVAPGDPELIWAARACYLEATWRESDCIALLWVAQKRAQRVSRPWIDVLRDYSAIEAKTERAREVRAFPWGDIPGKADAFNQRWQRLRELVVEVAAGQHKDPCPRAEHWGGSMDHPKGRMIRARCAASTVNTFYAVRAK